MDIFEDSFKLHDMIENDIRSARNEFGDYFYDLSFPSSGHLDMSHMDDIDRDLSNDEPTGWLNSSHILNGSTDFDSIGGLLVNPRTALPVSLSDPMPLSSSVSSSLSESSSISSVSESQASPPVTSSSISVSLPIQGITSNSDMTDVNLTVDVPTPSPKTHSVSSQSQVYPTQDADSQDNTDSPKLKSKKNSKSNHINSNENTYPKPAYSYSCLIAMALKNSKTGSLPVNEIYDFMTENFPYFKTAPNGWKNSVRHNLSLNKCFEKIEKPAGNNTQRKGYLWAMNPAKIEKMEEELQKWGSKDPAAIRKSMANPERLELIEKGELRNTDSESEVENMSTSQVDEDEESPVEEKENEVKVQVTTIGNDLLNNDYSAMGESVNMDNCLNELEMQKGMWDNIYDERLQFLNESPISPLSPKNSETMDDEASLGSPPSSKKSYVQGNFIYKCAPRTSTSDPSNRLIAHTSSPSGTVKGTACNV